MCGIYAKIWPEKIAFKAALFVVFISSSKVVIIHNSTSGELMSFARRLSRKLSFSLEDEIVEKEGDKEGEKEIPFLPHYIVFYILCFLRRRVYFNIYKYM